jgi:hypothetical protein
VADIRYSIIASWANKLLAASHRHGRLSRFRVGFKVKDASSQSLESSKASGQTALSEGRVGVDHWIPPPLRARTDGLVSLKQLSDVRFAAPSYAKTNAKLGTASLRASCYIGTGIRYGRRSARRVARLEIVIADPYALAPGTTRRPRWAERLNGRCSD